MHKDNGVVKWNQHVGGRSVAVRLRSLSAPVSQSSTVFQFVGFRHGLEIPSISPRCQIEFRHPVLLRSRQR